MRHLRRRAVRLLAPLPDARRARVLGLAALSGLLLGLSVEAAPLAAEDDPFAIPRRQMVDLQIAQRGITDARVLAAMEQVPRHLFIEPELRRIAYEDRALPIGDDQNVLQPYLVALMAELLELEGNEKVLEIGTGCGYQAAVLSRLAGEVYSIEIVDELAQKARRTLDELDYDNVTIKTGDGFRGWSEHAPFDAIVVTAALNRIPEPLVEQLKEGGVMVIPVGEYLQDLKVITKTSYGTRSRRKIPVRLERMTGEALQQNH